MKNISINQLIVVFFIGILLFGDFSKIIKSLRDLIKETKIYKNLKKK
jgi:Sec-independent protein translocase protein TatA